jgi:hypothetical protein
MGFRGVIGRYEANAIAGGRARRDPSAMAGGLLSHFPTFKLTLTMEHEFADTGSAEAIEQHDTRGPT